MGNSQSPAVDPRFTSASRAFTQKELEDLKSLFDSLASQSQSNGGHVSLPVFQAYFGLNGSFGQRMFDLVTQQRKDDKVTFEDLVIAKATYEKGTDDEIDEFIYRLLDVNDNGILTRSDLESVMALIFECVFSPGSSEAGSGAYKEMMDTFLDTATFSRDDDVPERAMTFEDFRSWCMHIPSVRKFLGSLLMPPDQGRPGFQVPELLYPDNVDPSTLLLKKEYAWHIGGALHQQDQEEWKLLYHSALHGLSFNTFFGSIANNGETTVLIIKDREGYVYGGYASQPWERHSDFYGDMKSFLFLLHPKAAIFRPTGANTNIQWCGVNFTSESIPNGIGFGGRVNHFGLFVNASLDEGQSFLCTTFGSPGLSKKSKIEVEVIECWGVVQNGKGKEEEQSNGVKGTVLERFKEDRNMLKMVGMANSSE